jgi:hypothetical protein
MVSVTARTATGAKRKVAADFRRYRERVTIGRATREGRVFGDGVYVYHVRVGDKKAAR